MTQLEYPFPSIPEAGEAIEITKGLLWARMPLPMSLDHINVYLLEDGDGWWIVDTGMNVGPETQQNWEALFSGAMQGRPVKAVLCTHMHPDHLGQAGWLCDRFRVPLYMSTSEYYQARYFSKVTSDDLSWTSEQYALRCGYDDEHIANLKKNFRGFGGVITPMPGAYRRLREGDTLTIGDREWQIIIGRGHSPEHVCLYTADDRIMLSGDQIIPRITSNISVTAAEPEANPLQEWLESLQRLLSLPRNTLICPSHNEPFKGVRDRLRYLIQHHHAHLKALEEACETEAKTAIELLPVLFKRLPDPMQMGLAVGEAVAHVNYLVFAGRMSRALDVHGAWRYSRLQEEDRAPLDEQEHLEPIPLEV